MSIERDGVPLRGPPPLMVVVGCKEDMLVKAFHKASLFTAIVTLVVLLVLTAAACLKWGLEAGLTLGLLAFMILGGFEAVWYLLHRRYHERIDDHVNKSTVSEAYKKSENNPTIR